MISVMIENVDELHDIVAPLGDYFCNGNLGHFPPKAKMIINEAQGLVNGEIYIYIYIYIERERERETERDRERQRETERDRERQRER